ncbi:MAG: glycoside hydrolase family 88 protein [Verrucomicrobiota bacterium]
MMRILFQKSILAFAVTALVGMAAAHGQGPEKPYPSEVEAVTRKVADWQIETYIDMARYRALPLGLEHQKWRRTKKYDDNDWTSATFHLGLFHFAETIDEPGYMEWLKALSEGVDWKLRWNPKGIEHADDHAMGQLYLDLYEEYGDPVMIADLQSRFDAILEDPEESQKRAWFWCDALFMGPATWARLARVTEEEKYLYYMDRQYHLSHSRLYNPEEGLFYRGGKFMKNREKNGAQEFWARGNGWVYGGLVFLIPDLPPDWEGRQFYIDLFQEMSLALKRTQRSDGTWSMGMLGNEADYPIKEISGTAFFVFGLAWGVNEGLLDHETYEPVILDGWKAMVDCVNEEGMPGYVQGVGAAPGASDPGHTEIYATGAFVAAGAEVYCMIQSE